MEPRDAALAEFEMFACDFCQVNTLYTIYSKISNISLSLLGNKMSVIHNMCARIANMEDPDQSASAVCSVCLCLFDRQLVFEILEQIPKCSVF